MRTDDAPPSNRFRRVAALGGLALALAALLAWLLAGGRAAPEAGPVASPPRAGPDVPLTPLTVEGLAAAPSEEAPAQTEPPDEPDWQWRRPATEPARPSHLPLDVETIDALSGRRLAAAWAPVLPEGDASAQALGAGPRLLPVSEQGDAEAEFALSIPLGFAAWDEQKIRVTVARRARALRHVHPLRPEAPVHLVVSDPEGRRAHGVTVDACVARRRVTAGWNPVAGSGRLAGLPYLRGERVQLLVREAGPQGGHGVRAALWEGRLGDDPQEPLFAEVTLPLQVPDPPLRLDDGWRVWGLPHTDQRSDSRKGDVGRLEVILLGRDGQPLPDTHVLVPSSRVSGWTDATGFVAFDPVFAGECRVVAEEVGVVETSAKVRVARGETTRVTMREAQGGTLHFLVVDEDGRFLPCATLMISGRSFQPYCDISDDGVQRTDLITDPFGRRTLSHVTPGHFFVGAYFGDRSVRDEVEVRDGEETLVRLVVK